MKKIAGVPVLLLVAAVVIWALTRKKDPPAAGDYSAVFATVRQYDAQGTPSKPVYGVAGLDY